MESKYKVPIWKMACVARFSGSAAQQVLAADRPPLAFHEYWMVLSTLCVAGGRRLKSGVGRFLIRIQMGNCKIEN